MPAWTHAFIDDHTTVTAVLADVLRGMLAAVHEAAPDALGLLALALPEVPPSILALHFTEAQERLTRATGEDVWREADLAPAHERWLGVWARRKRSDFLGPGDPVTRLQPRALRSCRPVRRPSRASRRRGSSSRYGSCGPCSAWRCSALSRGHWG